MRRRPAPITVERKVSVARVQTISRAATRGQLRFGHQIWPCALGRGGQRVMKREGDGATPIGRWAVRSVYSRGDRMMRTGTSVPFTTLRRSDGWCDAVEDRNYNRPVRHPYPASAERLWREDHVYDLIVVLGYNDAPRRRGRGSAIFMHAARLGYTPTEGCIALALPHLIQLVQRLRRGSLVVI